MFYSPGRWFARCTGPEIEAVGGTGMSKILEVTDLQVSFHTYLGELRAVRGVSFHLNSGETLAFVGESGCGKTVTAKSILRLIEPPQAEIKKGSHIIYDGEEVLDMDEKRLREYRGNNVSMIFQDPMTSLNPTMRCGDQITEALMLHTKLNKQEAKDEALRMLELVEIPDPERKFYCYPHELSGGMRQRVMIAIALSCRPNILIADEPTTALDVTIQAQILDVLHGIKRNLGTAIILITHNLGVVATLADRVIVMYAGQVVESGTTREIFYESRHPYTWALLRSIPRITGGGKEYLYSLEGTPPDLLFPIGYCPFAARCEYCMRICKESMPPNAVISETHEVFCWLEHPMAPRVRSIQGEGTKGVSNIDRR